MVELLEQLKNELVYEPDTGNFYWLVPKQGRKHEAGTFDKNNYRIINFHGTKLVCTKIAWYFMTGQLPICPIGFKDGNPKNTKWDNLKYKTKDEIQKKYRERGNELNPTTTKQTTSKVVKRATFTHKEVQQAVEEFIKNKVLVNGRYQYPESDS